MPKLNTNREFKKKKKSTLPIVKLPKNIKEAFNIDVAYENGIFKIEPGEGGVLYDQCYLFEDINYISEDEERKETVLLQVMEWFKSINTQIKITVANEQRDMEKFVEEIFRPLHHDRYQKMENGVGMWINQKIHEGTRDIERLLYLTVTCRAKSEEEARVYFRTMDSTLEMVFSGLKSRLYRLSGVERLTVIKKMLRAGDEGIAVKNSMLATSDWKNQVYPAGIRQEDDCMKIDGKYVSVLFAQDYRDSLDDEKVLHSLTDTTFPVYITLDIEPVSKQLLTDKLTISHVNMDRQIAQEQNRKNRENQPSFQPSYFLAKKQTDLEDVIENADKNDESAVFLGMLVMVYGKTLEEMEQRVDTLQQIALLTGYTLSPYYNRQLKALNTLLPIGGRQVDNMRLFLTSSAVAFNPFHARDLREPGGFVFGLNRTTNCLLCGDRKKLMAPHGMIVGHTGSGKSFFIKQTEIAQGLILTNDDIVVIDPGNEQVDVIRNSGGQYFDLTPKCTIHLNAFEVPKEVWDGDLVKKEMFVAGKGEYVVSFVEAVMSNIVVTQVHKTFVLRALRAMYDGYFAGKKWKDQPTLKKLWKILKEQGGQCADATEKEKVKEIVTSLEEYVGGVYDMFAHPSNIDSDHRLIGFGLKKLPTTVWEAAMVTIMHFLTQRIEFNEKEKIAVRVVIDETQYLCARESTAEQLLHCVELYRKMGGIITLAIQNLSNAIRNERLKDMFSNCPFKVFLDQGGVDANQLTQIQELSEIEYRDLNVDKKGFGLIVWGNQVYRMDASMSEDNPLFELFDTDFHKQAAKKTKDCGVKI